MLAAGCTSDQAMAALLAAEYDAEAALRTLKSEAVSQVCALCPPFPNASDGRAALSSHGCVQESDDRRARARMTQALASRAGLSRPAAEVSLPSARVSFCLSGVKFACPSRLTACMTVQAALAAVGWDFEAAAAAVLNGHHTGDDGAGGVELVKTPSANTARNNASRLLDRLGGGGGQASASSPPTVMTSLESPLPAASPVETGEALVRTPSLRTAREQRLAAMERRFAAVGGGGGGGPADAVPQSPPHKQQATLAAAAVDVLVSPRAELVRTRSAEERWMRETAEAEVEVAVGGTVQYAALRLSL